MHNIDLSTISKEVQQAAVERGYPEELPEFSGHAIYSTNIFIDYNAELFDESIKDLDYYSFVSEYPEYFGKGLKGLIKRIIIKCVRFYVLPVVEKQNLFNKTAKDSLVQIHSYTYEKNEELQKLREQIKTLQEEVKLLKNKEGGQ